MGNWLGPNPFESGVDESALSTSAPWNSRPAFVAVYKDQVYDTINSCPDDYAWARFGKVVPTNCKTYNDILLTVSGVTSTGSYFGGHRTGFNPIVYAQSFPIQVTCSATPNGVWIVPFAGFDAHRNPVWQLWSDQTFEISYTTFCPDPNNPGLNCGGNTPPGGVTHTGSAIANFNFYLVAQPHNNQNPNQGLSLLITTHIQQLISGRWSTSFVLRSYDYDAVALPSFFSGGGTTIPPAILNPLYSSLVSALQSAGQPTSVIDPFITAAVLGLETLTTLQASCDQALVLAAGYIPPGTPPTEFPTPTAPWYSTAQAAFDTAFTTAQDALAAAPLLNATFGATWRNGQTAVPTLPNGNFIETNIAGIGGTATAESILPLSDPSKDFNCLSTTDADGNVIPLPPPVLCDPNIDCGGWQPNCEVSVSATESECYQVQNSLGQLVPLSGSYEFVHPGGQWTWGLRDTTQTGFKSYLAFVGVTVCTGDYAHFGVYFSGAGAILAPNPLANPVSNPDNQIFFADPSVTPFPCSVGFYAAPNLQCLADFQSSSSSSTSSSSQTYAHTYEDSVSSSSSTAQPYPQSTSSSHSSESSMSLSSQSSQSQPPYGTGGGKITGTFSSPLLVNPCGAGSQITITFGGG